MCPRLLVDEEDPMKLSYWFASLVAVASIITCSTIRRYIALLMRLFVRVMLVLRDVSALEIEL